MGSLLMRTVVGGEAGGPGGGGVEEDTERWGSPECDIPSGQVLP